MAIGEKKITKRELDAQETKNNLLITAIKLFSEYGFETVTVDDITKRAGVSKGTFYTHFTSKESVLMEQYYKIGERYREAFNNFSPDTPASERLRVLVATMCEYCSNVCGVNVMKVVYMNQIGLSEKERIINENYIRTPYELLKQVVELGYSSGEFKVKLDSDTLVEYLKRFMRSLIYDWCLFNGERDLETMGQEFFDLIIKWLKMPQ